MDTTTLKRRHSCRVTTIPGYYSINRSLNEVFHTHLGKKDEKRKDQKKRRISADTDVVLEQREDDLGTNVLTYNNLTNTMNHGLISDDIELKVTEKARDNDINCMQQEFLARENALKKRQTQEVLALKQDFLSWKYRIKEANDKKISKLRQDYLRKENELKKTNEMKVADVELKFRARENAYKISLGKLLKEKRFIQVMLRDLCIDGCFEFLNYSLSSTSVKGTVVEQPEPSLPDDLAELVLENLSAVP